ncbi:MAG: putative toxin-antitoxin system toxin component, PIN family [Syntrophales bacterium]|nr:putative toxin-antitoxin system toxin component, PIN family [Syntrophales bacterium]
MVPKIVLDTNVVVSAFGWQGSPHHIFLRCIAGDFRIHISPFLLQEATRVLSYPKLGFSQSQTDEFISLVVELATIVEPDFTLDIITADPSDNRILECAAAAGCRYIVTGDSHLLKLTTWQDIQILAPDVFLSHHPVKSR